MSEVITSSESGYVIKHIESGELCPHNIYYNYDSLPELEKGYEWVEVEIITTIKEV